MLDQGHPARRAALWPDLAGVPDRFRHEGERARHFAFPLGGIGAGGFSISGSGRLVDWSIRNRPNLQSFNGYSHFAVKAERAGRLLDARVLNGPYDLDPTGAPGARALFDGYGHGANRATLVGLPHFREVEAVRRFPFCDWLFTDARFPGAVRLSAWSPFIPHDADDSGMPVGILDWEVVNDGGEAADYVLAGTLGNHGTNSGDHRFASGGGLSLVRLDPADPDVPATRRGGLAMAVDREGAEHTDHHFRGQWFDDLAVYWREFARPGPLPTRRYDAPRSRHMYAQPEHATLGVRLSLPPGGRASARFAISWHFPVGEAYWSRREKPDAPIPEGPSPTWTNWYATRWQDAEAVARDALRRATDLRARTAAFRDAMASSTLPPEALCAATSTLALLRTATILRLRGGEIWGWEGQHRQDGSCEGSCTHVYNYQQALPHLFPALERTLRETELTHNMRPDGGLTFRQKLPLGSGLDVIGPCADGHFGAIIKLHRDWRLSGDDAWLARWWPRARRSLEYAWSPDNPDRWDPRRTGLLSGRQHHTLDMELFGPNSWLASFYVAALLAAADMARALGEDAFAARCERMGRAGAAAIDARLWNGRWYVQGIDLSDRALVAAFDEGRAAGVLGDGFMDVYWSDEFEEVKYQLGEGCLSDQVLGQWHAEVGGLGRFLDEGRLKAALQAVFRHNFRPSLADQANPCRNYAFEDEGGLVVASYPEGVREPMVAVPYATEVFTGIEYASASHMIMNGLVEEGLAVVRAARDRHDGTRRNPFNDIECGAYYARALSAWQVVNALSGLVPDLPRGRLTFAPRLPGDLVLPWSAGGAFGLLRRRRGRATLEVVLGRLDAREVVLDGVAHALGPLGPGESVAL